MIIPVRCFSCGNILANKYAFFCNERKKRGQHKIMYFDADNTNPTEDAIVLNKLGLTNMCCRNIMLTHVDINV
jgi:DNA-directed RNA polymerase subunit N (RpoN/RPB10)